MSRLMPSLRQGGCELKYKKMTEQQIIEGNKLIAEFMGLWESEKGYLYNPQFERGFKVDELQYDLSWDWLMPVVEKIEELNYDVNILGGAWCIIKDVDPDRSEGEEIIDTSGLSKHQATYKACIEFIKWHNENTK